MGIDVSAAKAVSINDTHENGVDTSIDGNPSTGRTKGIPTFHVFKRNYKGKRRDDGNPLVHALKGRKGYHITPFWKAQLNKRARQILGKISKDLHAFDHCLAIPSSATFCSEFALMVSEVAKADVLESNFIRKRSVGEVLQACKDNPPKVRTALRTAFTSQLHTWEELDPTAVFQAKNVDTSIRPLFDCFALDGEAPQIEGKNILIVDDLFATGSSLLSVRNIVTNELGAKVAYVSFLSGA